MDILIEKIRIKNFRALRDVEVTLKPITILVGTNNSGKTTFLKALNSVFGFSKNLINKDDLFVDKHGALSVEEIIVDIKIIPVDDKGKRIDEFTQEWSSKLGGDESFLLENEKQQAFALRTTYTFAAEDNPTIVYRLFSNWDTQQVQSDEFRKMTLVRNNIKMYFIDAQRDILEDTIQRTSFFGRLVSQLDYGDKLTNIEDQMQTLNNSAVEDSLALSHLKTELKKLNQTTQTQGAGVSINPFPKKISDLHKGMKVYFQDTGSDTFSMEYHGMGTRSWASIITAGAFTSWELKQIEQKKVTGKDTDLLFPIFGLEEPEAHLHPNAQRTLYKQLKGFNGQKIISTHSPYIAGQADLEELRHFYKSGDSTVVSEILFDIDDKARIKELNDTIDSQGRTPEVFRQYHPQILELQATANKKLTSEDKIDLHKEIMLSRGELFFAKALILFEGITEELALPVFYKKYFNRNQFEDGITFISVDGKNYNPFLKIAKYLKCPAFILSDGDGATPTEVQSQINNIYENLTEVPLFVYGEGADFEKYLVDCGFKEEIIKAIDKTKQKENYIGTYIQELNGQKGKGNITRDYNDGEGKIRALLDCMGDNKTAFAQPIAEEIVASHKPIPPKIKELFESISTTLNLKPTQDE